MEMEAPYHSSTAVHPIILAEIHPHIIGCGHLHSFWLLALTPLQEPDYHLLISFLLPILATFLSQPLPLPLHFILSRRRKNACIFQNQLFLGGSLVASDFSLFSLQSSLILDSSRRAACIPLLFLFFFLLRSYCPPSLCLFFGRGQGGCRRFTPVHGY